MKVELGSNGDLLDTLRRIEELARTTRERISGGYAEKGTAGLVKIEDEAKDARARVASVHQG